MKRKLAFLGAILLAAFIFTYEGNTYQTHALDEEEIRNSKIARFTINFVKK